MSSTECLDGQARAAREAERQAAQEAAAEAARWKEVAVTATLTLNLTLPQIGRRSL